MRFDVEVVDAEYIDVGVVFVWEESYVPPFCFWGRWSLASVDMSGGYQVMRWKTYFDVLLDSHIAV